MAQKCRFSQVIWDEVRKEKRKRLFFLRFSRLVVCCVPSLSWQIIAGVHKKNSGNSLFLVLVFGCGVSRACFVLSQVEYEGDIPPGWGRLTGQQEADRFWCGGARRLLQFKLAPVFGSMYRYLYIRRVCCSGEQVGCQPRGVHRSLGNCASCECHRGRQPTLVVVRNQEPYTPFQAYRWCKCGTSHEAYPVDLLDLFAMCHP